MTHRMQSGSNVLLFLGPNLHIQALAVPGQAICQFDKIKNSWKKDLDTDRKHIFIQL